MASSSSTTTTTTAASSPGGVGGGGGGGGVVGVGVAGGGNGGTNILASVINNKSPLIVGNSSAAAIASQLFAEKPAATTASGIHKAFREFIKDPKHLEEAANYLYTSLLDDAIVGVFIEIHHLNKTGNLSALDGVPEEDEVSSFRIVDMPNFDIFGISTAKKPMDCTCPNCDRPVSAARFAPHLEKCMGMGRISSRIASRRLATKDVSTSASSSSSSSYLQTNANTDDEDDVDWSSEKRRKKTSQNSRNGSKKNNGKSF